MIRSSSWLAENLPNKCLFDSRYSSQLTFKWRKKHPVFFDVFFGSVEDGSGRNAATAPSQLSVTKPARAQVGFGRRLTCPHIWTTPSAANPATAKKIARFSFDAAWNKRVWRWKLMEIWNGAPLGMCVSSHLMGMVKNLLPSCYLT